MSLLSLRFVSVRWCRCDGAASGFDEVVGDNRALGKQLVRGRQRLASALRLLGRAVLRSEWGAEQSDSFGPHRPFEDIGSNFEVLGLVRA